MCRFYRGKGIRGPVSMHILILRLSSVVTHANLGTNLIEETGYFYRLMNDLSARLTYLQAVHPMFQAVC